IDGYGLHLRLGERRRRGVAGVRQVNLHALHGGGAHEDEDDEEHIRQVEHRRDVDVVVGFVFLDLHGGECRLVDGRGGGGTVYFALVAGTVELGHFGDEFIREDVHVAGGVLDLGNEVVVAKERGNRDGQ